MVEKDLQCGNGASARRHHERGFAVQGSPVGISAGCEEFVDHRRAAIFSGQPERGRAVAVREVHVGAGGDQNVRHFEIVAIGGPLDGRCPVGLDSVDIRFLPEEHPQGGGIAFHGSVGDCAVDGAEAAQAETARDEKEACD